MKKAVLGVMAAVFLHGLVFLFGGFLIPKGEKVAEKKDVLQEVDVSKDDEKKDEEPKEKVDEPLEDVKQDMLTDIKELQQAVDSAPSAPALSNMSLSDLGSALSGAGGDGGFGGGGVGFGSGGVIGGTGSGTGGGGGEDMMSGGMLDTKPTPTNRVSPKFSADVRKRLKGKVEVLIVVGKDGSVSRAEVLNSPDPAANQPCIEAAREWRFQPGTRSGKPVSFKLKLPFRFD
ncbi:MAG: energy transducer TonB [Verrucomicrobiota bacterium]